MKDQIFTTKGIVVVSSKNKLLFHYIPFIETVARLALLGNTCDPTAKHPTYNMARCTARTSRVRSNKLKHEDPEPRAGRPEQALKGAHPELMRLQFDPCDIQIIPWRKMFASAP